MDIPIKQIAVALLLIITIKVKAIKNKFLIEKKEIFFILASIKIFDNNDKMRTNKIKITDILFACFIYLRL